MKVYEFIRNTVSSTPGYEMDELIAINDNARTVGVKFYSERNLFKEVVKLELGVSDEDTTLLTEYDLDRILIENEVYVKVVDDF